jgi:hypothetical protein
MRTRTKLCAILAAGCALGVALTPRAAAVTDEEFEALKKMVQQLGDKVQKLEQVHDQDQKTHEQDQQQIQHLKQQVGETQKTATEAQQKADTVAQAQAVRPMPGEGNATHNFTMVGDAEIQFGKIDGQHSGFALADFAPIFLYRAKDNLLFEAGVDITLQNGTVGLSPNPNAPNGVNGNSGTTTTFDLSFAQLDFLYNDYVTFVGGDMLLPLGTYTERSAGWLNKIPDDPLPREVLPSSGVGVQLRGAIPVGDPGQYISYSAFGVNGPSSVDGTGNATTIDANGNVIPNLDLGGNVGFNSNGDSVGNLHGSPAGGGRVAWFRPWKAHYDVELGLSGQGGTWDNAGHDLWSAGVVDAAVHLGPSVEVKGEYVYSWEQTTDMGTIHPQGWWVQAGYMLAGLNTDVPLFNNLELVFRYDTVRDGIGDNVYRWTGGYVYYFSNNLLFEGDYEVVHSNNSDLAHNRLVFQLGYGF